MFETTTILSSSAPASIMNVPSVFRKAIDGFIIPPQTFPQMFYSAARGAVSLLTDEKNRREFIEKLDKQIINEGVISQATAGPIMMLSLFNELQNPLFKKHEFDASEFLEGVAPALERFHNVSGALENQLRTLEEEARKKGVESPKVDESFNNEKMGPSSEEKNQSIDSRKNKEDENTIAFPSSQSQQDFLVSETGDKNVAAVLEHSWTDDAKADPESMAGQLSRMVTTELFDIHQMSAKTAFLLQPPGREVIFKEGSCTVNNVALLSARSFRCVEKDAQDLEQWGEETSSKYEMVDYEMDEQELKRRKGGVAAQVEVLYDVTQEFDETDERKETEGKEEKKEDMETTIVSVAVMEGWLHGGPEGELRWKLALHRPAFEFPGIAQ